MLPPVAYALIPNGMRYELLAVSCDLKDVIALIVVPRSALRVYGSCNFVEGKAITFPSESARLPR